MLVQVIHVYLRMLIVLRCFIDRITSVGMVPFLNEIPRIRTRMSNDDATEREIRKPLISQALQQVSSGQSEENEAGQGLGRTLGTSGCVNLYSRKQKSPLTLRSAGFY